VSRGPGLRASSAAIAPSEEAYEARNHPFVDGNKRTALLAALVFLDLNGITVERETDALYELTMGVAEGRVDKAAAALELSRAARDS
jgi:death-on-curing protein